MEEVINNKRKKLFTGLDLIIFGMGGFIGGLDNLLNTRMYANKDKTIGYYLISGLPLGIVALFIKYYSNL